MPYLGNIPSTVFSGLSYQDLTGGTGTSFTLDYSVSSAQDIEVFVNNVRQEPGVAYTTAGTTLTMTGSIAATDDFYVVFQAKTFGTVSHPAGNSLQATTGTFSSNVDVGGSLFVDTIKEATGTNTAMTIGSNGLIQPKQVAFQVAGTSISQSISPSTDTVIQFNSTPEFDTGGYWDATNHRYTPQVAGWYFFSGSIRLVMSTLNGVLRLNVGKNGSSSAADYLRIQLQYDGDRLYNGSYQLPSGMIHLNGSTDYVDVYIHTEETSTASDQSSPKSYFSGFLVHAT